MKKVILIVGPTCVGKTKLSIELAKELKGEVINADSTQVYEGLDIATAKVTTKEKGKIKHHLFDIKTINDDYTVYDYQLDSRKIIDKLLNNNTTPILVGGTGLYIKACLYDYKFCDENMVNQFDELNNKELYNKLKEVDPNTDIHVNNRKRVIRAYQYFLTTNERFSEKEKDNTILYDTIIIGLTTDRNTLYEKINNRVDNMVNNGLLEEAKKIYDTGIRTKAVMTPIGYKELFPYFENKETLEKCLEVIKQNSRHYAKRQYTWFNNQMKVKWFNVNFDDFNETTEQVMNYLKTL